MKKIIHISVVVIYFITSCFVVSNNRWKVDNDLTKSKIYSLISSFTIAINDNSCDNDSDLPILIKDPKEDVHDCIAITPSLIVLNFESENQFYYYTCKKEEPSLNIISPPPQIS